MVIMVMLKEAKYILRSLISLLYDYKYVEKDVKIGSEKRRLKLW
jgi:hypothetical protein